MTTGVASNTFVFSVGLERYDYGDGMNLPGAAATAVRFARWAHLTCGVPQEHITLACSWLEDPADPPLPGANRVGTTRDAVDETLQNLVAAGGGLLLFFWCGHGLLNEERERILFTGNATTANKLNVPVDEILKMLSSNQGVGFDRQVLIIDACATFVEDMQFDARLPRGGLARGTAPRAVEQSVLFAAEHGELAGFDSVSRISTFSQEVLTWLEGAGDTLPPDVPALKRHVRAVFEDRNASGVSRQHPVSLVVQAFEEDDAWIYYGARPSNSPKAEVAGVRLNDNPSFPPTHQERRAGYLDLVREITPMTSLLDREEELAELAGFCRGSEGYLWLQGGPWAGKSALLSTFVLTPPPDLEVVSFFITRRYLRQADGDAFTEALTEQLTAICGPSPAGTHTKRPRHADFLGLFNAAGELAGSQGRRLVLVVDGLDEDAGAEIGSGTPSIAALLPKFLPTDSRVIVASRMHPGIPTDVAQDHPLRSCRQWIIVGSPHARAIQFEAERELAELLAGDELQQDLVGFVSASGGGLAVEDLEYLTGRPRHAIERLQSGAFGRTLQIVKARSDAGRRSPGIWLFAHESLRTTAHDRLGTRVLGQFRDKIHAWARTYRSAGWPDDTPQFLLLGYPSMLEEAGDVRRLIALTTDEQRHDRMLDMTGGDHAAMSDLSVATRAALHQPEPDLAALLRIAMHRAVLETRNSNVPLELVQLFIDLRRTARAESLAFGIVDRRVQMRSVLSLIQAYAKAGHLGHARAVAVQAETLAAAIAEPSRRSLFLAKLAEAVAGFHDFEQAMRMVGLISETRLRDEALTATAKAAAAIGEFGQAELMSAAIKNVAQRVIALAALIKLTAGSDPARAQNVAAYAKDLVLGLPLSARRSDALSNLCVAIGATGALDDALALAAEISDTAGRANTLIMLAKECTKTERDRAQSLADEAFNAALGIVNQRLRTDTIMRLTHVLIGLGSWSSAELVVGSIKQMKAATEAQTILARALAAAGELSRARAAGMTIKDPVVRAETMVAIVTHAVDAGETDFALTIANAILQRSSRVQALCALVREYGRRGDPERAALCAHRARMAAVNIADLDQRGECLMMLVREVAATGDIVLATSIAKEIVDKIDQSRTLRTISAATAPDNAAQPASATNPDSLDRADGLTDPNERAGALMASAESAWAAGDGTRSATLADRAAVAAASIVDLKTRTAAFVALAQAAKMRGDNDRAVHLAITAQLTTQLIIDPKDVVDMLGSLSVALGVTGNAGRAIRLAGQAGELALLITDDDERAQALEALVGASGSIGDFETAQAFGMQISDPHRRAVALSALARMVAETGDLHKAKDVIEAIADPHRQAISLGNLTCFVAETGNFDETMEMAMAISDPHREAETLLKLATIAAGLGRDDVLAYAEAIPVTYPVKLAHALAIAAKSASEIGDPEHAKAVWERAYGVSRTIRDAFEKAQALALLAGVVAEAGDLKITDRAVAEALTALDDVAEDYGIARVLTSLVLASLDGGSGRLARKIARQAAIAIDRIPHVYQQDQVKADLVVALAAVGDRRGAHELLRSIANSQVRWPATVRLVGLVADIDQAHARHIADTVDHTATRAAARMELVRRAARDGYLNMVRTIVMDIGDADMQAKAFTEAAELCLDEDLPIWRPLLANALAVGSWTAAVRVVARVEPDSIPDAVDRVVRRIRLQ